MHPFLRGVAAFFLLIVGTAVSLFSVPVAFGWGHRLVSLGGAVIAILGLALMFGGYWLIRDSDAAPLAAALFQVALGLGSTFLVYGLLAAVLSPREFPIGYFIFTGCLCIFGFVKFRSFIKSA